MTDTWGFSRQELERVIALVNRLENFYPSEDGEYAPLTGLAGVAAADIDAGDAGDVTLYERLAPGDDYTATTETVEARDFLNRAPRSGDRVALLKIHSAEGGDEYLIAGIIGPRLYRFTLNEDMGASSSNEAGADLLHLDGTDTTLDVTVLDPASMFSNLKNNAAGYCIQQGGSYYAFASSVAFGDAIWQFTLTQDMGASTADEATATKLNADGTTTGETITVIDGSPNSIFSVLTDGSSGWCFEKDGVYYIIQAECADGGDTVTIDELNDIADVTITSVTSGEVLKWNGSAWINQTLAEAGIVGTADTSLAGNGFFEDDDTMASDSALKAASIQSIRAYIAAQIANLVDSAPGALDTLNELAASLGDDDDFAGTMTAALALKAAIADVVANNLFDANTILKADSDNTPAALTVGASTLVGRGSSGSIAALTATQVRTLLGLVIGTNVQAYSAELTAIASGNAGSGSVSTSPSNYTAAGPTVDEHLTGIDDALGSVSGGGIDGGSAASVYLPSQSFDFGGA